MVEPSILLLIFIIEFERGIQVRGRSPIHQVPNQPLMHNGVVSVDEASHTNKSKLYDYALAHMWVNVVAQVIGWLT